MRRIGANRSGDDSGRAQGRRARPRRRAAQAAGATLPARVTLDGVDGVVPGMTPAAVGRRRGVRLRLDAEFDLRCQTAVVRAYGARLTNRRVAYDPRAASSFDRRVRTPQWELRFDVVRGRVTRIAFGDHTVRNTEGCA
jgi:hypothetical protein